MQTDQIGQMPRLIRVFSGLTGFAHDNGYLRFYKLLKKPLSDGHLVGGIVFYINTILLFDS